MTNDEITNDERMTKPSVKFGLCLLPPGVKPTAVRN